MGAPGGPLENRCRECGAPAPTPLLTVADAMTRDPVTLGPEDTLMHATEVMRARGIRRAPIVLGDTFLGLLAEGDLKRAQPSTLSDSEREFNRVMESTPVSRIMIANPITVTGSTPLLDAARTLHTTKYGALPVLDGGRLVGILTDSDLLRCLVDLLTPGE